MAPDSQADSDLAKLREFWELWFRAVEAGDVAALRLLVTEDIVFVQPDATEARGKDAFCQQLEAFFESYREELTYVIDDIQVANDWAIARVTETTLLISRKEGEEFRFVGKHLAVLRREASGRWKLARDLGNSERRDDSPSGDPA
jgi:uncharacterized protein (TIGR02246 family)